MKRGAIILHVLMMVGVSCNKPGTGSVYQEPQIDRVKATIAINGGSITAINSSGTSTYFRKTTNSGGDLITSIYGSDGNKQIGINIFNITTPGTYTFSNSTTGQRIFCSYSVGNPTAGSYQIFYTGTPPPPTGSVTITEFTSTYIKGVFTAIVLNAAEVATITNGSFEGTIV